MANYPLQTSRNQKTDPTGAAWVPGEWNGIIKSLVIGSFIGLGPLLLDKVYQPHEIHRQRMTDPIYHMLLTPGIQQLAGILAVILLAPVSEEMMFRGILYGGCRKSLWPISAAIITTGIFVAIHLPYYIDAPFKIVPYVVVALALLWCRLKWNAIGPAIAAHGGYNLVVGVVPSIHLTLQYYHSL
jgi:membrane protease YdiL (CAAX protease family)